MVLVSECDMIPDGSKNRMKFLEKIANANGYRRRSDGFFNALFVIKILTRSGNLQSSVICGVKY